MTNAENSAPVVRVEDLIKDFGAHRALNNLSLTVPHGQRVVLLGKSGSGKSTLLRHLNGLEKPTAGTVEVLGQNVGTLKGGPLRELRRRVGVIFQRFELVPSLSVIENVLTGALGSLAGARLGVVTYPKAKRERALEHLETVGLGHVAFQRADTLSGGQQQRVAIARALMQEPELLLADEPVASLDPESSRQVMDLLARISAERGLTLVTSLHQIDLALSWGERIVGLKNGHFVIDGPPSQLDRAEVMDIYGETVGAH